MTLASFRSPRSPLAWPQLSLMRLKRSISIISIDIGVLSRRQCSYSMPKRASNSRRLVRPVSASVSGSARSASPRARQCENSLPMPCKVTHISNASASALAASTALRCNAVRSSRSAAEK
ncbi:hypothetical protein ASL20_22505 [Cupriavidus necator]|nr:hypothetical protein ASL20_22505 [Cupriavidus necator]